MKTSTLLVKPKRNFITQLTFGVILLFSFCLTQAQTRIYITPEGNGEKDGTSWSNAASNLYYWINNAPADAEIWLKQGIYKPHPSDRTVSFSIKSGVKVYGGFAGTETMLSQRNYTTNVTILSGEIGASASDDNSYHVIYVIATTNASTTIIDGITISNGNANGTTSATRIGAGAYLDTNSAITFRNCKFSNNSSYDDGGAIYLKSASVFENCEFSGNGCFHPTQARLGSGGALYISGTDASFINCTFEGNYTDDDGGAICIYFAANTSISNCTFTQNTTNSNDAQSMGGGIMIVSGSNTSISNSTFTNNTGGGIYTTNSTGTKLINNTIAYNNNTGFAGVYINAGTAPILKNNLIAQNKTNTTQLDYYGGVSSQGGNVIEVTTTSFGSNDIKGVQSKLNLASALSGSKPQTLALQAGSVAIDAGQSGIDVPTNGENGVVRGNCPDIGAFEFTNVAPTQQATLSASNLTTNSITVGFAGGNGIKRIVMMKYLPSGAYVENPIVNNGTTYSANSNYLNAPITTNGFKIVYNGTATSVNVTGLAPTSSYRTVIFDYNGCSGDEIYLTTIPVSGGNAGFIQTLQGSKQDQAITFQALSSKTYGDDNFNLTAQASSGLTVTYTSSDTGVATVSGNTVSIVGAGSTTITARQPGNEYYNEAPIVERTLIVGKINLTVNGATAQNKVYDGNTNAVITGATLVGIVGSDDVSLTNHTAGIFSTKDIGTNKSVTNSMLLTGTKANNYQLIKPTLTANIIAKALTVSNATVTAKIYDGNTNAAITGATVTGLVQGESVILNNATVGSFNNKNFGTNKPVATTMTISGTQSSNYTLTQPILLGTINKKELTVTGTAAQNKTYDGTITTTISGATLTGVVSGDLVSLANATSGTFASKNVANGISVTTAMTLTGTDTGNYTLTQPAGLSANITHKELTVTGASVTTKAYDGTRDASITGATLSGVVGSDAVTLGDQTYGRFDSPLVGTRIPVSTAMTISGKNSANYTLTQPSRLRGNITAKELTVTGAVAQNKVYDGGTTVSISGSTLTGVISGDDCTLGGGTRGTFSQSTVGTNISVSTAMTLQGDGAGNYTLAQPTGLSADITTKSLTVTANNITKSQGTTYTFSGTEFTTSGLVGSDVVSSASFSSAGASADAAIGSYTITPGNATGTGLSNYSIAYVDGTLSVEERTELTLSGLTANAKTYDGTTTATISNYGTLVGVEPGHSVSLVTTSAIATFANKNYGDVTITVTGLSLAGSDADKYFIGDQTTTAIIHKRPLTLTNLHANDKIYNGNNYTSGNFDDDRIEGDDIILGYSVRFDDKMVGENKTVNFNNIFVFGGADQINYYVPTMTRQTTASIFAKDVEVINAVASAKVYDGTNIAIITGATLSGVVSGDVVSLNNHTSGTFDSKNIGNNKPIAFNMTLTGADAANYNLIQPSSLEANITSKELTVTGATVQSKNYDGNTDATITGATLVGKITGEDVQLENQTIGTFDNKNVGSSKPVSTAMTISGSDIANYTFTPPTGLTSYIDFKTLTVSGTVANNKVYDGFLSGYLTGATLEGVVGTEDVSLSRENECYFTQATVGANLPVTPAMTLIGSDIANYFLQRPAGLTANITPKELTVVSAIAQNKEYDGNTNATITGASLSGKVSGDDVALTNATIGVFEHKNVGKNIVVTTSMTITGTAAFNYTLAQPSGLNANISAKELTVTGVLVHDKEYDRTVNATISGASISGKISGDDVTLSNHTSGTFGSSNIGVNVEVLTSMNITGNDAANYNFTQPTGLKASITAKGLTISANDIEKNLGESYTFVGTEFSSTGLINGDEISSATLNSVGADVSAVAGDYPITISGAIGSGLPNYNIQYIEGTFTVNSALSVPENYNLRNTTLGNGAINCYNAQNDITVAGETNVLFESGSTANIIAGHSIRFLPGFHAEAGSSMNAYITTNGSFCNDLPKSIVALEEIIEKSEKINETICPFKIEQNLKVYPNPNNGIFTVELSNFNLEVKVLVFNSMGSIVKQITTNNEKTTIDLSNIQRGIYVIRVMNEEKQLTQKVLIQ